MKPETQYKLLVKVASADRAAGILARIAGAQQVKQAAMAPQRTAQTKKAGIGDYVSDRVWNNVWDKVPLEKQDTARKALSIGGGALAGLGAGAGVYALTGLSPAMKKKKLYRILAALGAGAGVGTGAGFALNKGLAQNAKNYNDWNDQALTADAIENWNAGNQDKADALMALAAQYRARGNMGADQVPPKQ